MKITYPVLRHIINKGKTKTQGKRLATLRLRMHSLTVPNRDLVFI